jgi:hypothetical protein
MKYRLIRDKSDEMRQSLIKISGLEALKSGDKSGAQSSAHNDFVCPARHSSFPSWMAIDSRPARLRMAGPRRS